MATHNASRENIIRRAREEIEKKTGKTPEQLHKEREKRITDALNLKEPDRIPVFMRTSNFPLRYAGMPLSTMFYDPDACKEAMVRTLVDFQPDISQLENAGTSGLAMETLNLRHYLWPGGPLRPDQHHQFIDAEIMKEDEYDIFLTDPTDFMIRYYLPRRYGALESFLKLPPLGLGLGGSVPGFQHMTRIFAGLDFQNTARAIHEAGLQEGKFDQSVEIEVGEITGVPVLRYPGGAGGAPLDWIGDYLRGMSGMMVDMFKQPEKLLAACENVLKWRRVRTAPASPKELGKRVSGGAAHWISKAFISRKQYETFCWPTWKKALLATIDMGFVPVPHCEGKWDDRLDYFLELPKGKAFLRFEEEADVFKAKDILGNQLCIIGGVPGSLIWGGSPQEVEECCRKLIKVCGKGGGFILGCDNGDDAKPANLKAMVDSVEKYGRY